MNKTCAVVLVLLFLSVGCDAREVHDAVYKAEDTLYSVKIIEVSNPPSLDIDCDYSNIEIYSWDDKKVKIEMTKRVKGVEDASELNNFDIQIVKDQDTIKLTSKYKGKVKSPFDRSVDVRAYLPKKIKKVSCKLDVGSVKFYDDIKGDIDVAVNMANIEINRIEGQLTLNGDMGDVRILNGVIRQGSSIRRNWGSIFLKAKFENEGFYDFETDIGNIELTAATDSNITVQATGNVKNNDFERDLHGGVVKLKSKMGKITATKTSL